jgi:hypothetical protein
MRTASRGSRTLFVAAALWLAAVLPVAAAQAAPKATGQIRVDVTRGELEGNICVEDWPAQARSLVLNAGLNLGRLTDGAGAAVAFNGLGDGVADNEGLVYGLTGAAPSKLCASYVGRFPVYPALDAPTDFKGLIAFNGDSVRAAEQAVWLPTPFARDAGGRIIDLRYDLTIDCGGCRLIYLNGGAAQPGPTARFASETARPPLLFAGPGPATTVGGLAFVNVQPEPAAATALAATFSRLGSFYGAYMGEPIADQPTLLRNVAVDDVQRVRRHSSWGFASWPTIALAGVGVDEMGHALGSGDPKDDWVVAYLAHETGHYYFGHRNIASGPYTWFLTESLAEFLSIKAERAIAGEAPAGRHVARLVATLDKSKPQTPFDQVTSKDQVGSVWRYDYGPLLLLALEREAGELQTQAFVRALMRSESPRSWAELETLARKSGMDPARWSAWRARCVTGAPRACVDALAPAPAPAP